MNPEHGDGQERGERNLEGRRIEITITERELQGLQPESSHLKFTVIGLDGSRVEKEITVTNVNQVGELYVVEGTTRPTRDGGGSLVTLEINPHDAGANQIMF